MSKKLVIAGVAIAVAAATVYCGSVVYGKGKFKEVVYSAEGIKSPLGPQELPLFKVASQESTGFSSDKYQMNLNIGNITLPFELVSDFGVKSVSTKINVKEDDIRKINSSKGVAEAFKFLTDHSLVTYSALSNSLVYTLKVDNFSKPQVTLEGGLVQVKCKDLSAGCNDKNVYTEIGFNKLDIPAPYKVHLGNYLLKSGFDSEYYLDNSLKSITVDMASSGKIDVKNVESSFKTTEISKDTTIDLSHKFTIEDLNYEGNDLKDSLDDFGLNISLSKVNVKPALELCKGQEIDRDCAQLIVGKLKSDDDEEASAFLSSLITKDTSAQIALNTEINDAKVKADVAINFTDGFDIDSPNVKLKADASVDASIFEKLPVVALVAEPMKMYAADPKSSVLEYHLTVDGDKIELNGKPLF